MATRRRRIRKSAPRRASQEERPFSDCREELVSMLASRGIDLERHIVTSRDKACLKIRETLACSTVPEGFVKWRIPVFLDCAGVNFYLSAAASEAKVASHSHTGPTIRFIIEGSVIFKGVEYTTGDWIYLPANRRYSFSAGPLGATSILGYCCCCA